MTSSILVRSPNPEQVNRGLAVAFRKAHRAYLRANIDRHYRKDFLYPLQNALSAFEANESTVYGGSLSVNIQALLHRLKSVSILVEGYFWIGAIQEGSAILDRYMEIEDFVQKSRAQSFTQALRELSRLKCFRNASQVILDLTASKSKKLLDDQRRVIQEAARIGVNIAMVKYYSHHHYRDALALLERCLKLAEMITEAPRAQGEGFEPYGLKGQCYFFSACCHRQVNSLKKSEELFTESLDMYVRRINAKYEKYIERSGSKRNWIRFHLSAGFSRYRTAVILCARADLNYRKGLRSVALHQNLGVARIILGETTDTINRAHARLQYAIISRELAKNVDEIRDALTMVNQSLEDFKQMGHAKYETRALFERAFTLFYLARFLSQNKSNSQVELKRCVDEALSILEDLRTGTDHRWQAQYYLLESRILVIVGDFRESQQRAQKAIRLLEDKPNHITYLIEAYISKSRALMEQYEKWDKKGSVHHLLEQADDALKSAGIGNQNMADGGPSNNKIEAIINFARARIKIREGKSEKAKEFLEKGLIFLPNIESQGVKQLYRFAQAEIDRFNNSFVLRNGLDIHANKHALEGFLIERAIADAPLLNKKPWELVDRPYRTFWSLAKKHGIRMPNKRNEEK